MNKLFEKSAKLRSLKESVVGIEKIRDDPFANDRIELAEYESVLKVVRGTMDKYQKCLADLCFVHGEMMGELKRFYDLSENVPQKKRVESVDAAVDSIADSFMKRKDNMELLLRKTDALLVMHEGLNQRLQDRDKAFASKAHYESKMSSLLGKEKDRGKVERNMKKQEEAEAEFKKTEDLTIRECRDALNTKYKDLDQILGLYMKYLCDYYGDIGRNFASISNLPEEMMVSSLQARPDPEAKNSSSSDESETDHAPLPPARPQVNYDTGDAERNELRAALGLRLKGRGAEPLRSQEDNVEDNDSDLTTPPLKLK